MKTALPAVKCSEVTKTYGESANKITALKGINLEVRAGELLMIAGPSGCGKTTLISIIAGILDQDKGSCQVYGQELALLSPQDIIAFRAKNIGFVFQAFNLLPSLTAAENVAIPLMINGMERQKASEKAAELLRKMGLQDRVHALPAALSGGQQQRVAIARALVHDPRLVVCDEPTSALDGETGHKIIELMKVFASEAQRTLIVVTHDARIFSFADRIARMEDGNIVKIYNSPKEFDH